MAVSSNTKNYTSTYVDLGNPVYEQIENKVLQTYKKACICWIEENKNPSLLKRFAKCSNGKNVLTFLFHGTDESLIDKISSEGFKPNFNKRSVYGNGVYFSTRAEYSKDYSTSKGDMAYMFVCDVVIGKVAQGRANTDIPSGYDSCVDYLQRPDMYIVNKTEAAYPRYIVAFYPYAQ